MLQDNQLNHRRPWPDATRAGVMGGRRFTPYGTYNAHPSTYWNAAAVASTQVPQPVPCGTWPTKQPTGGSSGATAAAEQTNQITEEEESPVSDFYCSPVPRVTDCLFDVRHPGPDAPAVKGWPAPIAGETRRTYASCGRGQKD